MKIKKKVKKTAIIIVLVIAIAAVAILIYKNSSKPPKVEEVKILNKIDDYEYALKDNKTKAYQDKFNELIKILSEKEVDEEKYVSKISEMFILDFYSLNDKTAKTDIGGVDFVHPDILANFLENAENTYYKYVESNIYNNRQQKLPTVSTITINSISQEPFSYSNTIDEQAYKVSASWTYTDEAYSDYQNSATLVFVHKDKLLCLVELK